MEDRLAAFFKLVVDDPTLKTQLKACGDRSEWVARAAEISEARGYNLSADDIAEALDMVKALKTRIREARAA